MREKYIFTKTEADSQVFETAAETAKANEPDPTPWTIWEDNHSGEAEQRRQEYTRNGANRQHVLNQVCIDARREDYLPTFGRFLKSIAASGDPLLRAIEDPSIKLVNVESHVPDCGGRLARETQIINGQTPTRGSNLNAWIHRQVYSPDARENGFVLGRQISEQTEKPVIVTVQNHLLGELNLAAVYLSGEIIQSAAGEKFIPPSQIQDEEIARFMNMSSNYLARRKFKLAQRDGINTRDKGAIQAYYEARHRVHNPRQVNILTDLRSEGVILPGIDSLPGYTARLSSPRGEKPDTFKEEYALSGKPVDVSVPIKLEDILSISEQLEYIITQAVENHGKKKSFANTDTLFIGTTSYAQSVSFAREIMGRSYMPEFLALPKKRIIVARINIGEITKIGQIEYAFNKKGRINHLRDRVLIEK